MSKYIVEIKPEYEDSFKGLMILGAKDSNLFVDALAVEDIEELNSDYINEHFGDLQDTAYQKGFEDGKAQSENGCEGCMWEGNPYDACEQCSNAYKNLWTAMQKTDEIKVGDEVEHNSAHDIKVLVTDVDEEEKQFGGLALTASEHNCDIGDRYSHCQFKRWHKTGRHFDIGKILEELRHES